MTDEEKPTHDKFVRDWRARADREADRLWRELTPEQRAMAVRINQAIAGIGTFAVTDPTTGERRLVDGFIGHDGKRLDLRAVMHPDHPADPVDR